MSKLNILEIEGLKCSYPGNTHPVVFIEHLEIPRGKMTVVLGRSGSGKSTLIEAIGLMNSTITAGNVHYYSPFGITNLAKIWNDQKQLTKIRRDYFSFIFQDDYLLPHYTCRENALIARLIQRSVDENEATDLLAKPMNALNLSGNGLFSRLPYQIAGGQKQRLSFTRAVLKDFDILFGDEPTGNLDNLSSVDLFDFILEITREKGSTAIIVSHNIELSVEKADKIIVLTPAATGESYKFGLQPGHLFCRDQPAVWDESYKTEMVRKIKLIL